MTSRTMRRMMMAMSLLAGGAAPLTLDAQPPVPASPAEASTPAVQVEGAAARVIREQAADWMTRVALVDLRVNPQPQPRDYAIGARLLQMAYALRPGDQDILRLAIDAATQSDDRVLAIMLARELVRLDPGDQGAQLSLITSRVEEQQTVEGRINVLNRFLGDGGQRLDPAIRSRLALDAALLHREAGDAENFAKRLADATALDPTNKDAASLALEFFSQRVDDVPGRVELLINLLTADPLDPDSCLSLSRALAGGGAFKAARRFYLNAVDIRGRTGEAPSSIFQAEGHTLRWLVEGPEAVVKDLTQQLMQPRRELERYLTQLKEAGQEPTNVPKAEDLRLPPDVEEVRLLAAEAMGDKETAKSAIDELIGQVKQFEGWQADPLSRPAQVTSEFVERELSIWRSEVLWLRLWSGQALEGVDAAIDELAKVEGVSEAVIARLRAWSLLRAGNLDDADAALKPLSVDDPLAMIGLGVAADLRGDKDGAVKVLSDVAVRMAGTLPGTWAGTRASRLSGGPVPVSAGAAKLQALADGVPSFFDEFTRNPRSFMGLFVEAPARQIGPLERGLLRVRLQNASPIPLAVGGDRPINSRLLISPDVDAGGRRLVEMSVPEVLNLDRKLRLGPREEIAGTLWVDPGYGGWALAYTTGVPVVRRWRVLQGFELNDKGVPQAGGLCLTAEASGGGVQRTGVVGMGRTQDELLAALGTSDGTDLIMALHVARLRLLSIGKPDGLGAPEGNAITEAIRARYEASSAHHRIVILALTPTGLQSSVCAALDRGLRDVVDVDPAVILMKIVTRALDEGDAAFAQAKQTGNTGLIALADGVKARLGTPGHRSFSSQTSVTRAPTGPAPR